MRHLGRFSGTRCVTRPRRNALVLKFLARRGGLHQPQSSNARTACTIRHFQTRHCTSESVFSCMRLHLKSIDEKKSGRVGEIMFVTV